MAQPLDLASYDDETLDAIRVAVLTEQERRARVAQLPDQLADMARDAVDAGVNAADVRAAVERGIPDA